jgi:hypothetical protein
MSVNPTSPARYLEAIAELARAAAVGWPQYESTEAALAAPSLRSTTGGAGMGSDTPDPVHDRAVSHERYFETAAQAAEAFGILREIQNRMAAVRKQHPETARAIDAALDAARCTGIVGDDPTCTRNAVRNVNHHGSMQPTCWACIKRAERAEARTEQAS